MKSREPLIGLRKRPLSPDHEPLKNPLNPYERVPFIGSSTTPVIPSTTPDIIYYKPRPTPSIGFLASSFIFLSLLFSKF